MRNQRDKFSIPKDVTYLNCAFMAPLSKAVEKAGEAGLKRKRNPLNIPASAFFIETEILRAEYAKLIHVRDPKRIVVIPSVSYGIANVVNNVKPGPGEKVVVAAEQFPSNYYPWHSLTRTTGSILQGIAPPDDRTQRGKVWNERILDAIDSKTRIVSLGNVHWADGTRFDLQAIRKRTREVGALLIIDGSQSVGAMPFDVAAIQPDALICTGYKWLMGPYSIGLAYYGEYFDQGKPVEENWINRNHSEDFTGLVNYQNDYQQGSLRYEVGEHSNFIMVPMMLAALKQINQWKPQGIQQYCLSISKKAIDRLRDSGFWIEDEAYRGHHLFGVRFPKGYDTVKAKERILKKKIAISFRGDSLRIAANVYNTTEDFEKLLSALL